MKNWSVDLKKLKKNPAQYELWKTEQLVNFGLNKSKIDAKFLKANFTRLSIDPEKKAYLSFLLWPEKKSSRKRKKNS